MGSSEIEGVKTIENSLSLKTNLETTMRFNNPSVNQITQNYENENRAVKFKEEKVEEFKSFQKIKKENTKESSSRRSINVQNPIPNQNTTVGLPFNLTIDGTSVFSSTGSLFLEATHIPTWLISTNLKKKIPTNSKFANKKR